MLIYEEMRKSGFTSIVQIKGDVRTVLGKDVFYRFYEVRRAGFRTYAINVSCGLESAEDLIEDLSQALSSIE